MNNQRERKTRATFWRSFPATICGNIIVAHVVAVVNAHMEKQVTVGFRTMVDLYVYASAK